MGRFPYPAQRAGQGVRREERPAALWDAGFVAQSDAAVYELDASFLKGTLKSDKIIMRWHTSSLLEITDGAISDMRRLGKVIL